MGDVSVALVRRLIDADGEPIPDPQEHNNHIIGYSLNLGRLS